MTDDRSLERVARGWLEEGPTAAPDRAVQAALDRIDTTSQEWGRWAPWRLPPMHPIVKLAGVAVLVGAAIVGGIYVLGTGDGGVGGPPSPDPTAESTPAPASTATPVATATPEASPLDTSAWTEYVSERYALVISYPPDWTERPATEDWTLETHPFNSPTVESFLSPGRDILVSAWSVAVEPGTTLEGWVQGYCEAVTEPCDGMQARAQPVFAEIRDQHPGVLVPFSVDVHAFVPFWYDGEGSIWDQPAPEETAETAGLGRIFIVAAWRPPDEFDSVRLVEAFTLTMGLDGGS